MKRQYKFQLSEQTDAELFESLDRAKAGIEKNDIWSKTDKFVMNYIKNTRPDVFHKWQSER